MAEITKCGTSAGKMTVLVPKTTKSNKSLAEQHPIAFLFAYATAKLKFAKLSHDASFTEAAKGYWLGQCDAWSHMLTTLRLENEISKL